jgi:hypothetical protein
LSPAKGCRTDPPGYIGLRSGATTLCRYQLYDISLSVIKNLATAHCIQLFFADSILVNNHSCGFRNLYKKKSIDELNTSLSMKNILYKDKNKVRNLKS